MDLHPGSFIAGLKTRFKTSCIALMIKIRYEGTHFYKIQNVVKTEFISIQARKELIPGGEPRVFFCLQVDWPITGGREL